MTTPLSSRRSFIVTAGAALSVPLAAAAAAVPGSAPAPAPADPLARLALLEDQDAIRRLNVAFAKHITAGAHDHVAALFVDPADARIEAGIRGVSADATAEADDLIEVAADRATATTRLHRVVHSEEEIGPSCPLVEMAREQGGGVLRRSGPAIVEIAYAKQDGAWKIQRVQYRAR